MEQEGGGDLRNEWRGWVLIPFNTNIATPQIPLSCFTINIMFLPDHKSIQVAAVDLHHLIAWECPF